MAGHSARTGSILVPVWQRLHGRRETALAVALLVFLLIINLNLNPAWLVPSHWGTVLGLAAPLAAAAIASTPAILGGRGGIDVSIGPLMGLVNAIIVKVFIVNLDVSTPWVLVPAALIVGILVGAVNGALATIVRIQPIVATLGTSLVLAGATLTLLPVPMGTIPQWFKDLAGPLSIVPLVALAVVWLGLKRTPFYEQLMAIGSDDRACFSAGVPVGQVRFLSYVLGGLFAGVGGLTLTALIGSADPTVGPKFTLIAISAVALGGIGLAGGRGGFTAALVGAIDIFLLQSALTYFNVSTFILQVAYGLILVGSVSLNALTARVERKASL